MSVAWKLQFVYNRHKARKTGKAAPLASEMPNGPNYYGKVGKVEKVWNKVMAISGFDASAYRVDAAHHLIARSQYGTDCPLRWEIDHKTQKSHGGSDYITNLQPLNTATNRSFGNRAMLTP